MSPIRKPPGALATALVCGLASAGSVLAQAPSPSAQVAAAVVPLPAGLRAGAGVVALDGEAQPHTLRPSANGMVCIADAPGDAFFEVECHHASFIPVIYRMKQLAARGLPEAIQDQTIEAEIRSGSLSLPTGATTSYGMSGPIAGYDASTNTVSNAIAVMHMLHVPFATAAGAGLPSDDDGMHPYMMAAGTYYAHVMLPPAHPASRAANQCIGPSGLLPAWPTDSVLTSADQRAPRE